MKSEVLLSFESLIADDGNIVVIRGTSGDGLPGGSNDGPLHGDRVKLLRDVHRGLSNSGELNYDNGMFVFVSSDPLANFTVKFV